MLLGTSANAGASDCCLVSIPREDSCFWEHCLHQYINCRCWLFQSPERIHAFGNGLKHMETTSYSDRFNPQRGFMLLGTMIVERHGATPNEVSIPREDSCFWERGNVSEACRKSDSFNPQRGFMLLGSWWHG